MPPFGSPTYRARAGAAAQEVNRERAGSQELGGWMNGRGTGEEGKINTRLWFFFDLFILYWLYWGDTDD